MFRNIFAIVALSLVALTGCGSENSLTVETNRGFEATIPVGTMDRCKSDDGEGAPCVWVADEQGTAEGTSFVILEDYNGPTAMLTSDEARSLSK